MSSLRIGSGFGRSIRNGAGVGALGLAIGLGANYYKGPETAKAAPGVAAPVVATQVGEMAAVSNIFVKIAQQSVPGVVNIYTTKNVRPPRWGRGGDPGRRFFEEFFGQNLEGMPPGFGPGAEEGDGPAPRGRSVPRSNSLGSGFVIERNGDEVLIVTNNHVIEGADDVKVQFTEDAGENGTTAIVVGTDPDLDVALLRVKTSRELTPLPLGDSEKLAVGEWIAAVGNPFGHGHSMSHGIVSAKERALPGGFGKYLQVDAPINPGNSGGPLVNLSGEVVGINNAIDGRGAGIGFAIPVNAVKNVLAQLKSGKKIQRGFLGLGIQPLEPELASALRLEEDLRAPVVTQVSPGMPAAKAGLRPYDVITEVNGKPVRTPDELVEQIRNLNAGEQARVTFIRAGQKKKVEVNVSARPS